LRRRVRRHCPCSLVPELAAAQKVTRCAGTQLRACARRAEVVGTLRGGRRRRKRRARRRPRGETRTHNFWEGGSRMRWGLPRQMKPYRNV
jgi:hypothetical protein